MVYSRWSAITMHMMDDIKIKYFILMRQNLSENKQKIYYLFIINIIVKQYKCWSTEHWTLLQHTHTHIGMRLSTTFSCTIVFVVVLFIYFIFNNNPSHKLYSHFFITRSCLEFSILIYGSHYTHFYCNYSRKPICHIRQWWWWLHSLYIL